jgi:hypothetical protein
MWKEVIEYIVANGFIQQDSKEQSFHNEIVFRNPEYRDFIVKIYEGKVYLGVCFNATQFSFTSIVRYKQNNEPYLLIDGYNHLIKKYSIIENIVEIIIKDVKV